MCMQIGDPIEGFTSPGFRVGGEGGQFQTLTFSAGIVFVFLYLDIPYHKSLKK